MLFRSISKEIISEKFPNVGKEIVNQVQEAESAPRRINPRRSPPRPIVIKGTKIKDKVNKTQSNKGSRADNTQGNSPQAISWFLHRNSASQKESAGCVYSEERKILQSGTLEPARLLQSRWSNRETFQTSRGQQNSAPPNQLHSKYERNFSRQETREEKDLRKKNPKQVRKW